MGDFRMPSLGASMEAGTLVEWLKRPGDAVKRGDIIAVVDTEKGAIEIEVFEDGVLRELRVPVGEKVPVGTVLAVIESAARPTEQGAPERSLEQTPHRPISEATPVPPAPAPAPSPPRRAPGARSSPAARKAAEALGVDLSTVSGSGPHGAITVADVERAAGVKAPTDTATATPPQPTPPVAPAVDAGARMRHAIAAAMLRSKREIPHFYLATTIDMGRALAWLASTNAARPVTDRLLPAALLVKAVALALRDVPQMNGFWIRDAFVPGPGIHPGIAVSLRGGGLVAPALRDADGLNLSALMTALRDLVARARAGGLRSSEMADPTITITNLGDQGVEASFGIIYPPQVALVSIGRIIERPLAVDGQVQVRPTAHVSVSVDHRAIDGHRAGLFLAALDRHLQHPEAL